MTHVRNRLTLASALAAAALITGCQSGSGADPLSLGSLTKTADAVPDDGTDTCPLPYDLAEAAKDAGVEAEAGPGSAEEDGKPAATAEGGKRAEPRSPLAVNPGVLISCTFHIGRADVQVHTIATSEQHAIYPLAPVISSLASLSADDVTGYVKKAAAAEAGKVVTTDNGSVASLRLKLDGEGDAALLVGTADGESAPLTPEQLSEVTKTLAEQAQ
ncbi:hypothetical protein [Streptomyces sp. NPDC047725]|uniref:hypothetical protein n=1 Tax=Streptomyces sp. NPDC047725 TaxID=3365487 RepID=UPI00371BD1A7